MASLDDDDDDNESKLINYGPQIDQYAKKHNVEISSLNKFEHGKIVYDLLINGKLCVCTSDSCPSVSDPVVLYYVGIYYKLKNDFENMQKYLIKSSANKNGAAICTLMNYYCDKKQYDKMEKYYKMAIENGDKDAMNNLAVYYKQIDKKDEMMKYYMMAIEHKSSNAMYNLAIYYMTTIRDSDELYLKYLNMSVDHKFNLAMIQLSRYYKDKKMFDDMIKYTVMAVEHGYIGRDAIDTIGNHFENTRNYIEGLKILSNFYETHICKDIIVEHIRELLHLPGALEHCMDKCTKLLNSVKTLTATVDKQIIYIEHLELSPEGPQYAEAKQHFEHVALLCNPETMKFNPDKIQTESTASCISKYMPICLVGIMSCFWCR
ncbi:MAG: hypothetical protein Faunusvirus6_25 [Faunusvirus sp.]|jgi:pentatricopeptide repeat protein|uniref:Uncharacterized protein n=1 Tax=Faunusvirus sp. TaxID=2487766 RepID=A0A3G4ZWG8_9VIRU|nr:MAG: hypothetical protein Faunusvirus6_25 [Faunusvirus sp.]